MFDEKDLQQIREHGLSPEQAETQLENFRRGFPFLNVVRAASPGDGVLVVGAAEADAAVERYEKESAGLGVVKFVPASGAATRMFKELFEFVNDGKRGKGIDTPLENIGKFAFWPELRAVLPAGADDRAIVNAIVGDGLNYGRKPKGLVTFHAYPEGARKAVEEHLVEGAAYAAAGGVVRIHFTVSPEHVAGFEEPLAAKVPLYEKRFGVRYEISFSVQKPSTDTLAVNPDNTPFRQDDGTPLFRPAGHGALIENLNEIDADLIFIKNIDNVTTDARRGDTVRYKKVLAGVLLDLQGRAFEYLKALEVGGAELEPIAEFIEKQLCVKLPRRVRFGAAARRVGPSDPRLRHGPQRGRAGRRPVLGREPRRYGVASDRRVEPDRARRPAADAVGHALQSGGPRLRRARFEGMQVRSAPVHRSRDGIHLVEILRRPRSARAGASGSLERCDGEVEHGLRRRSRHDILSGEGGAGSSAPPAPIGLRFCGCLSPVLSGPAGECVCISRPARIVSRRSRTALIADAGPVCRVEETLRESGSRGDGLYRQRVSALADLSVAERNLFGDQFRGMSRACGGRHCGAAGLRLYICSICAGNLSK